MSDYNHEEFIRIILSNSINRYDYFEAVKEWVFRGERFREPSHCICGHYIEENCIIYNRLNGNQLITGNCCINKIGVERRHANKSRINYLELAREKAKDKNIGFIDFVERLIENFGRTGRITLSEKEILTLERITNMSWRWNK